MKKFHHVLAFAIILFHFSFIYILAGVTPNVGNCSFTCNGNTYTGSKTSPVSFSMNTGQSVSITVNGMNGGATTATQGGIDLELWDVTTQNGNQINLTNNSSNNVYWKGNTLGNGSTISQYLLVELPITNMSGGVSKALTINFSVLQPGTYRVYTKMYLTDGTDWPRDPSGTTPNPDVLGEGTYLIGTITVQNPPPIVSNVAINVSPTTVSLGQSATGSGSITGTGNGSITYVWEYQKPNQTSWNQYSTSSTTTMSSGTATLYSNTLAPPFDTPGNYIFRVRTTSPNLIYSNQKTVNVPEPPKPDLRITSISSSPTSIQIGGSFNVTYTVTNNGAATPCCSQITGIYLSTSQYSPDRLLFTDSPIAASSLPSGASVTRTKGGNLPTDITPGNYYIVAYANYNGAVNESNDQNNTNGTSISAFEFQVSSSTISISPTTVGLGQSATGSGSITGTGDGSITYVWEYQKPNQTSWNQYSTSSTTTMSSGTATLYSNTLAPPFDTPGNYIFRVRITSPNLIYSNQKTVNVPEPPKPDLRITSISSSPTSIQIGESFNVTYTVTNNGAATPCCSQITGIYLSTSQYSPDRLLFTDSPIAASSLPSGASVTRTKGGNLPTDITPGNYYIVAYANYNGAVNESNDQNNTNGTPISAFEFQVNSISIDVSPTTLTNVSDPITTSGAINGTGSGTVNYKWQWKKSGSSTWEDMSGLTETATMNNGIATISSGTYNPFTLGGLYSLRVMASSPNSIPSNEVTINVTTSSKISTILINPYNISGLPPLNFNGKPGTLVRLGAILSTNKIVPSSVISSKNIRFEIQINNNWTPIIEDGISTTNQTTSSTGLGENYYIIPDDLNPAPYNIRAIFDGDNVYEGCSLEGKLTVDPIINEITLINQSINSGNGIPLVLVHGNGADKSEDQPLSRWDTFINFIQTNPDLFKEFDIYNWQHITEIPIGFNGATGNAKQLANFLNTFTSKGKKVILVAHSQGGLICRSYMNYNNQGDNVLGLITLGTPHHGSPFAIPDWAGIAWGQFVGQGDGFNDIYTSKFIGGGLNILPNQFEYDRIGSLNLGWDNLDGALGIVDYSFNNCDFSDVNGNLRLSAYDMNDKNPAYIINDNTILFSDKLKQTFGTLGELNSNQQVNSKIITYGAFDDNLNDNAAYIDFINLLELPTAIPYFFTYEHEGLEFITQLLSSFGNNVVGGNINYFANDGMVPLQSSLFLDIAGGTQFAQNNSGFINLNQSLIDNKKQVKLQRIFYGSRDGIKDHLDLLDAKSDTYWHTLASDIRSFIPPTDNIPPSVSYISSSAKWYSSNNLFDIDFSDNSALKSVWYQIDSKDDSNPSNWHLLTSDGINTLPGSQNNAGTSLTADWKISDVDWNALNPGMHNLYFKVTDDAGNTYITPDPASAFQFGKDTYAPTVNFTSPQSNQVFNINSVEVKWSANDVVGGLPLSGIDKIYYALDQNTSYLALDGSATSFVFTNLSNQVHVVYLKAKDKAGNESLVKSLGFSVHVPATIASVLGNNQSAPINTELDHVFRVKVSDADGYPIQGIEVTFSINTTPAGAVGLALSKYTATTDNSGLASSLLTLGDKPGEYKVYASVNGLSGSPVVFTATATVISTPGLNTDIGQLSFGNIIIGNSAELQSFTVTGSNLTDNVTLAAPAGYQMATSQNGSYSSPLLLSPTNGKVTATIYVKFLPSAVATYNGNISITSPGTSSVSVSVSGTGMAIDPNLVLEVSQHNQEVPSDAGSVSFSVTSNISWKAVSDQPWCTVTPAGSGNGTIIATYEANVGTTSRPAKITVSGDGVPDQYINIIQQVNSDDNLVAYYPFSYDTNDTSTYGNHGVNSGITFTTEGNRKIAKFSASSYMDVPDNSLFDFSNASGVTIETWVKPEAAANGVILFKMGIDDTRDDEYHLEHGPDGTISGGFNNTSSWGNVSSNTKIPINTWAHIVLIWEKSSQKVSLYINGIIDAELISEINSIQNTSTNIRVGHALQDYIDGFVGSIDELKIYNKALNDNEILALFTEKDCPSAPIVESITQPTCAIATGSVALNGLPSIGTWTLTRTPGNVTYSNTGATYTVTGLPANTYTFTVTNASGCTSASSQNVTISSQPSTPSAPVIGTITQPTYAVATGSVVLSGLPPTGTWTLNRTPGNVTYSNTGTTYTVTGLPANTYTFTVTNTSGCISVASQVVNISYQPTLDVTPSIQSVNSAAGTTIFAITSNVAWTATSDQSWCTVTPSGTGDGTITVTYDANTGITSRPAIVSVSGEGIIRTITITQLGKPNLEVSVTSLLIGAGNYSTNSFDITSNANWYITDDASWLNAGTNSGSNDGHIVLTALGNSSAYTRPAIVTISGDGVESKTIAITQSGIRPTLSVYRPLKTVNSSAGSTVFAVTSNLNYTTKSDQLWCRTRGAGTESLIVEYDANTTSLIRIAYIVLSCEGFEITDTIKLTQQSLLEAPTVGIITQPNCTEHTGSVVLNGLPATGTWTLTQMPENTAFSGTGPSRTITGLVFGTYTYTVTDETGNISGISANVIINAPSSLPSAPIVGAITQPTCAIATGSVALNGLPSTGTWTLTRIPGNVTYSNTGTTYTVMGLTANTYTFTVTNASGCISAASQNVIISSPPSLPSAPVVGTITQPTCAIATGSVALSGLPSTGTWTLTRTPGNVTYSNTGTTYTVTGLSANTYTFTATNASGCTSVASQNVVIIGSISTPSAPVIGTITQPTCAIATGSVALSGLPSTGTWTLTRIPGNVTYSNTGTTYTVMGLPANTYMFTVTNASGCTSASSQNVTISSQPSLPEAPVIGTITQPTCTVATGSVALSGLPSTGTWTLSRIPGNVTYSNTGMTYTVVGLTANTYTFTVTNASGCTSASSQNVTVSSQPSTPSVPTIGTITQPTCAVATGSVALSGLPSIGTWTLTRTPGNVTYSNTGATYTVTGLSANTYTFTVTNASGCTSVVSQNVVITGSISTPTVPVIGTITQPTCAVATGSVALSGLPSTGTWTLTRSPGTTTYTGSGSMYTVTSLPTNTYAFTVTNASGCTSAASQNVIISSQPSLPAAPVIGTITQPTCAVATGSVALSGLPSTGTWTLTRTPGNVTYSNTGTTYTVVGLPANTYTFTVTNASGCTSVVSQNVVITGSISTPTTPVIGTITQPTCAVATGSVALTGLPSTGTWTLTRIPGNVTYSNTGTTYTVMGLPANTYTFTVTNASGCTSVTSQNVVITGSISTPSAPVIGTITQPTCAIATGSVALSGLPSTDTWMLTRIPGNVTYSNIGTTYTVTGLSANTYTFTVTNASGCTSVASQNVIISSQPSLPAAPVIGTITQPTCAVATGSISLSGLPSTGTWTLIRSPGNINYTGSGTTYNITSLSDNTYTFAVTNASGCTSQGTDVIINPQPTTPLAPQGTIIDPTCANSTGTITITYPTGTGMTYSFDGFNYTNTTGVFSHVSSGAYTVTAKNGSGCISHGTIVTIQLQPTTPSAPQGTIIDPTCVISTGTIAITYPTGTGMTYSIDGFDYTNTTGVFSHISSGAYTLTAKNASGCISQGTIVSIKTQPTLPSKPARIIGPANIIPGTQLYSVAPVSNASEYTWLLPMGWSGISTSESINITPGNNSGTISVNAKNECGSGDTVSLYILLSTGINLISPDVISIFPNPFSESITINFVNVSSDKLTIEIMDLFGRTVWRKTFINILNNNNEHINLSNLPIGLYNVRLSGKDWIKTYHLVKE